MRDVLILLYIYIYTYICIYTYSAKTGLSPGRLSRSRGPPLPAAAVRPGRAPPRRGGTDSRRICREWCAVDRRVLQQKIVSDTCVLQYELCLFRTKRGRQHVDT